MIGGRGRLVELIGTPTAPFVVVVVVVVEDDVGAEASTDLPLEEVPLEVPLSIVKTRFFGGRLPSQRRV